MANAESKTVTPSRLELRAFYAAVTTLLVIPLVVGPVAGFGGLEAMARLFGVRGEIVAPAPLRSGLRAITFLFFTFVPIVIWSLREFVERAGAFRIVVICGFLSCFARLTGYVVEGNPGSVNVVFMIIEIAGMPILLLWHSRLLCLHAIAAPQKKPAEQAG